MKINLEYLDQLQGVSNWNQAKGFLRNLFEAMASQIKVGWNTNHHVDGTHAVIVADDVTSTAGYIERGRTTRMGEWTDIPLTSAEVSSDSGTWTLAGGAIPNNFILRYMKVGKTIFLTFRFFNNSVITGTPEFLIITLPSSLQMARLIGTQLFDDRIFSTAGVSTQGLIYVFVGLSGSQGITTKLYLKLGPPGVFAASANFGADGQLMYEAANA